MEQKVHQGRNVKRFREMLGIKQEALAYALGEEWNQKKISLLENKEVLEPDVLYRVAKILKVPEEAIMNFDEEYAINFIANTFTLDNGSIFNAHNTNPVFHPIDKLIQLHEEKIALYERMLKEKDDLMLRLEQLINKK
ncbi:MAG: XRE family transcriptional regulator [Pedobacter sp.]|nr:MAG: XRE family transcriptional regulator [Pedobacter sp.]